MSTVELAAPLPRSTRGLLAEVVVLRLTVLGLRALHGLAVAARWALVNREEAVRLPWLAAAVAAVTFVVAS